MLLVYSLHMKARWVSTKNCALVDWEELKKAFVVPEDGVQPMLAAYSGVHYE